MSAHDPAAALRLLVATGGVVRASTAVYGTQYTIDVPGVRPVPVATHVVQALRQAGHLDPATTNLVGEQVELVSAAGLAAGSGKKKGGGRGGSRRG